MMSDNRSVVTMILPTKLNIPPLRPSSVKRENLISRMNAGLMSGGSFARRLTLVAAPAGFGKTTLVRQWLNEAEVTTLWLSLDPEDNDLHRFFSYLAAATGRMKNVGRSTEGLLASPQMVPPRSLATSLIHDISVAKESFLLVLDDYHCLTDAGIQEGVAYAIEHLPDNCHLVITTREQPKLPLSRYRARGQVVEIGEPDLRFSLSESELFLQETLGLGVSAEQAQSLRERTEGWAAGLQLAAVALQSRWEASKDIENKEGDYSLTFAGDDRLVADYLVDEVLAGQPDDRIRFLYYTSIVERLNGELANALTNRVDGHDELIRLEKKNLFLLPVDNRYQWFRYHSLFGGLLRNRLQQNEPEMVTKLHGRAAEWFATNNYPDQAIHHALLGADKERAAELIELVGRPMLLRGEVASLHRWLQNFSREFIVSRPDLLSIEFGTRLVAEVIIADPDLTDAELVSAIEIVAKSNRPEDEKDALTGELVAHRMATAASHRNSERALSLAYQAMEYAPADNLYLLAYLNMGLGFVYQISNQVSEAETAFKSSVDYATKLDSQLIRLNSINGLAELYEIQGQLSQAQDTHKQALALATGKSGEQSPVASIAYLGLAKIARERNELDAANEFLDKALSLARLGAFIGLELDAMITRALVRRAGQRWRDAQDALDEAEALVRTSGDMELLQRIGAFASRIWLAQNDRSKAIQWARSNRLTVADPVIEFLEIEYLTLARILLADKENEAVIDLLDRWQPAAEASGRHARLIEMLLLRGLAQFEQGNIQEATLVLGRALKLAAPEGFVRIFADEGPSTVKPLQETIKQFGKQWPLSLVEYSQRLVTIIAGESKTLPTRQEETLLLDPLSEREIQILKLIAAGLSNKEIAGELFLTVGTVKTYTHQLYGKLGVSRRTEAVDKAREKGII